MISQAPYMALAILSGIAVTFQLIVVQILSFIQWYHFAFMVISLALLGGGVAGTILFLYRTWFVKRWGEVFPFLVVLSGGSMVAAIYLSQWEPLRFDSFLLFTGVGQGIKLPLNALVFLLPFFFTALAVGLIITVEHRRMGKIYFWNLFGSGLGAVCGWGLLWLFPPEKIPSTLAIISVITGLLCLPGQKKPLFFTGVALVAFLSALAWMRPPHLLPSEYKDLSRVLTLPEIQVLREIVSPYGRVHIVKSPFLRFAPGLSLTFQGQTPTPMQVFINGDASGPLFDERSKPELTILDYTLAAIPWSFGDRQKVLVLTYDTGVYADYALFRGASEVKAVTPHPVIENLMEKNTRVQVVLADPRAWMEKDENFYDLIYFPVLGSPGGDAGLRAVTEDHLFTAEGVSKAYERLTSRGVMVLITWEDYPLRYPLKLFTTLDKGLKGSGERMVIRGVNQAAFLVKKTSFTPEEREKILSFSQKLQFLPAPGLAEAGLDMPKALDSYPFQVGPATDNRPYIHQFLRPRSISHLVSLYGWERVPFFEVGYLIVLGTSILVVMIASCFIFLPLLTTSFRPRGFIKILIYFSCLGLGYMLVEMAFIQRFVFYFGSTVNSMTVVVTLMLIASGSGSWMVDRMEIKSSLPLLIVFAVVSLLILNGFFLTPGLIKTAGLPWWMRLVLGVFVIAPLAFLMGMPFPVGIKLLGSRDETVVPWAWGVNGFFSVLGASLATVLSVETGFRVLIWVAAFAYMGTLPFLFPIKRS